MQEHRILGCGERASLLSKFGNQFILDLRILANLAHGRIPCVLIALTHQIHHGRKATRFAFLIYHRIFIAGDEWFCGLEF